MPAPAPELSALEVAEDEREARYEQGFEEGNLVGMLLAYNDLITDKEANDTAAEYVRQRIRGIVTDPETAENLCPTDHPLGTKRPCLDTNYYATYNPVANTIESNSKSSSLVRTPCSVISTSGVFFRLTRRTWGRLYVA